MVLMSCHTALRVSERLKAAMARLKSGRPPGILALIESLVMVPPGFLPSWYVLDGDPAP